MQAKREEWVLATLNSLKNMAAAADRFSIFEKRKNSYGFLSMSVC
jgi:hypothetical protein